VVPLLFNLFTIGIIFRNKQYATGSSIFMCYHVSLIKFDSIAPEVFLMKSTAPTDYIRLNHAPVMKTGILIRKPASTVFEAFVNPAITSKFWFTKGSGWLETGKQIRWEWEMYGHCVDVRVKTIEENKRIVIEWGEPDKLTTVEWIFTARPDNTTFVDIINFGFSGDGDEIVNQALDSMGGFSLVLAGAKAFMEHNINLNLIADRFPDGH
jgi:uncharacterized protein YndB with AHSA1/START domain